MCSQSDFFRTKVTSWLDKRENRIVDLTGHPSANVVSVIEFVYGATLNITHTHYNLAGMADIGAFLLMERVKEGCKDFIEERVNANKDLSLELYLSA